MVRNRRSAGLLFAIGLTAAVCHGQDLTPSLSLRISARELRGSHIQSGFAGPGVV